MAAANARKTSTRHAARTRELPAGPTADTRHAALSTRTAAGAALLATGSAALGGAATATRILLVDDMSGC